MRRPLFAFLLGALVGCGSPAAESPHYPAGVPRQSQSLALSADGTELAVVNPDSDSLSILDPQGRTLRREIALGARPQPGSDGRYQPLLGPRGVDLSPDGKLAYVACQWSGQVLAVATDSGEIRRSVTVGAEPVAVLVQPDGKALFVSVYQSGEVVRLPLDDAGLPDGGAATRQTTTARPWGLALDGAAQTLYVTRFLEKPGLDRLDPATLAIQGRSDFADAPSRNQRLLAHGVPRGLYGAAVRPGGSDGEVWAPHLLLATDTAQPELDFETTVFPAISVRDAAGGARALLTVDSRQPGIDGQFADVVSGPRALAFTPDGSLALMVNMSSEDVLVVDSARRVQVGLVRPLPGDLPEGIVLSADGKHAYIDERASGDVAVLSISSAAETGGSAQVRLDGAPIARLSAGDPMPTELRLGQRLFYSANSAEFAFTRNFWVSCASCHLEGRSDAVTWLFAQGPRDTPSNAGGTLGTGFLFRTAARNAVQQYDETIRIEQGGDMDLSRPGDRMLLDAMTAYVDRGIPFARSPETDPATGQRSAAAERGQAVFAQMGCAQCHGGARYTDSGAGNPGLDLGGVITLHDVGTCVKAPYADKAMAARDGSPRAACQFDTPSLNGVFDTAPYFHDGSAATLEDVIAHKVRFFGLQQPSASDLAALISFLRSL